jgi:Family of unknown function (DUF5946)
MVTPQYRDCPGCGVRLPVSSETYPDGRYNASAECWQLYGELTAYTVTRGYETFIHQLAIDAYAAQHVGKNVRPIGVAFALITLYLACEKGYNGRQAQHMLLAQRSKTWPAFTPPAHVGAITIADVMQAPPGEPRDAMIHQWTQSVWDAWSAEHARVKALFERVMAE